MLKIVFKHNRSANVGCNDLSCELCIGNGEIVLWQSPACRVIRVNDPHYPGFCRVIWNDHIREMSDLDSEQQQLLMSVVFSVEKVIRTLFAPDKINLASFGNMVPHVHWHIIPRWLDDRHFPEPVWGTVHREGTSQRALISDQALVTALHVALTADEN